MKKFLLSLFALLTLSTMAYAESYTISFKDGGGSGDKSNAFTAETSISTFVNEGVDYLSSITSTEKVYLGKSGYGLKFSSASVDGVLNLGLAPSAKVYPSSIVVTACAWTNSKGAIEASTLTVNGVTQNMTEDGTLMDYTFTFDEETLMTELQLSATKRLYVTKVVVNYTPKEITEVENPQFSIEEGTYYSAQTVAITCATDGASIYYTLNGDEPTEQSILYNGAISITETTTVKAIAVKSGFTSSSVIEATYTIVPYTEYSYELVTSVKNGGHYIIVGEGEGIYYALSTTQNKNNRGAMTVEVNNGLISNTPANVCELELQGSENAWSFYDPVNKGFLYTNSTGSNWLKLTEEATFEELKQYVPTTITFDKETSIASIKFNGIDNYNNLLFNLNKSNNNPLFSCYKNDTTTGTPVYLYQRVGDIPTGVEDTMVDENAPVEYYNLQGVKVANPENGIFIKKQGAKATKVVL